MNATTETTPRYWNRNGRHEAAAEALQKLIPASGPVLNPRANPKLERYRKAVNAYYDLYNNGLCNRAASFSRVFCITVSEYRFKRLRGGWYIDPALYDNAELRMDAIVCDAAREQGLAHLITG
jgi:hypothetical protein